MNEKYVKLCILRVDNTQRALLMEYLFPPRYEGWEDTGYPGSIADLMDMIVDDAINGTVSINDQDYKEILDEVVLRSHAMDISPQAIDFLEYDVTNELIHVVYNAKDIT